MIKTLIGTAGWNVPVESSASFPASGSHLERYSGGLHAVEINSSFYRHHQPSTYRRWAASTPPHFRFSVKLAKTFTHEAKLLPSGDSLRACLEGIGALGEKWGALLVQLPPSLGFEPARAENFLSFLKEHSPAPIVWEPRHPSWTHEQALDLLERYEITKVQADPEPCPSRPLKSDAKLSYFRLHGRPIIYRSLYRAPFLKKIARALHERTSGTAWCIFDNTTFGFAAQNALELNQLLHEPRKLAEDRIVS